MERYNSLSEHLKNRFSGKTYKLSLESGCSCPNRDGTLGYGGCIFCHGGSGDFAEGLLPCITEQIEAAKAQVSKKYKGNRYIAYFQSYTNTYGDLERLEALYTEAAMHEEIVQLDIATRPDCLEEPVLMMLERLKRIKPVCVELGLQTIHESTAQYIRRGYPLDVYDRAVRHLKERGIEVVVHMILGLPGESREDMIKTARYISESGADGIKLQLLHILKGTDLAAEYYKGYIEVLDMETYIDILLDCMEHIDPRVVIHRMTGDGAKSLLIAPLWSADKKRVMNRIRQRMEERDFLQGKYTKE